MRLKCFRILVHGVFEYHLGQEPRWGMGFYATRHILAYSESSAAQRAIERIRNKFVKLDCNFASEAISITFEADEVTAVSFFGLLLRVNRGHSFYERE